MCSLLPHATPTAANLEVAEEERTDLVVPPSQSTVSALSSRFKPKSLAWVAPDVQDCSGRSSVRGAMTVPVSVFVLSVTVSWSL